jgi:hypothetical protein
LSENFLPLNNSDDVLLESVARAPTYKDVAKTLSDTDKPQLESPKLKESPKKEKLRRIGLKMNSDDEGSPDESDDGLISSSSSSASTSTTTET